MNRKYAIVYIAIIFIILLIPFVGMTAWPTTQTSENTPLAEIPARYTEEDKPNFYYLSDWGEYFEDRFAFRQQLVTANACLYGTLFHHSTTDQVVLGKEGWLYYGGTLADFKGENLLTDREWFCLVHNLKLMQEYVESQGSRFLLTVAPNKNSLYGAYMPSRYLQGTEKNIDLLANKLKEAGVEYVDLYSLFQQKDEILYFKKDSHWNNRGAVLACRAMMEAMGKKHETYLNVPCSEQTTHIGDLDEMLYPLATKPETEYIYEKTWKFTCPTEDYMEDWIETSNPEKTDSLLMYRDSFGESLLPFVAEEFGQARFSRLVPYHLTRIEQYRPDFVVIERVERRLSSFAEEAPVMPAPQRENLSALKTDTESSVKAELQGSYLSVSGNVEQKLLQTDTNLYVEFKNRDGERSTYQPFYLSDGGFQLYLKEETVPKGTVQINVIAEMQNQYVIVASAEFTK